MESPEAAAPVSTKNRKAALLLALLLGGLGAHRFYLGRPLTGLLMLLTLGGLGFWVLADLILLLIGELNDGEGRKVSRPAMDVRYVLTTILTLVVAVGLLFLIAGAGVFYFEKRFHDTAQSTTGVVTEMREQVGEDSTTYSPTFSYTVEGQSYTKHSSFGTNPPRFSVGEEVTVLGHQYLAGDCRRLLHCGCARHRHHLFHHPQTQSEAGRRRFPHMNALCIALRAAPGKCQRISSP